MGGRRRGVAEAEHAVAAGVVQHGAVEGDDPRPARGQRDVGVHAVLRVEVDEACLHGLYLRVFVEVEQVGEGVLDVRVLGGGGVDRGGQFGMGGGELRQGRVVQAGGAALDRKSTRLNSSH